MAEYIDIGVNLTGSSFRNDVADVVQRAQAVGVEQMIVTGTDIEHSHSAIELCDQYPGVLYSTAGIHPHHASEFKKATLQQLRECCSSDVVVAVGECGLDYNRNFSTPEQQRRAFEKQLELAAELNMPVFLHQRDAHSDFVDMIKSCRASLSNVVAHCFTGTEKEVEDYLDLDMYIGVTGWICDERRGAELQKSVRIIPLDRIMLETDAPYLLPRDLKVKPIKKNRNEPCYLPHICHATAQHMNVGVDQLAISSELNAKQFFNIE